ncbi:MAG: 23S rRNA (adenine(2503)-C(2))-methyltransferase RlmN [Dysgonamonadaceae bacterium]|jgi:23S rRNA (adenine2503-C2)-methyltransferase|nr:23S rRNA (adenine(2503)-C(2))-methyltransferase RlmN [Dysgonamonadaceae bacterium]
MQKSSIISADSSKLLLGKTVEELKQIAGDLGMPQFTANQISGWLYKKRVSSIDEMTNLSLAHRSRLKEKYIIGRNQPNHSQTSTDGTVKYLFPTSGSGCVETVYIPDRERATLCVSSQIGCKMNCLFCMTGRQGFSGQLTAGDMLNQILSVPESDTLTNVVFMGMGEPLDNKDELFKTLEILTSGYGFGWSPKRITVSTIGVLPGLKRFLEATQVHLALSLHSPFSAERLSLMPVEKVWPMAELLNLIRQYDFTHQRRVSFEYICFGGLNDDIRHAAALARLLKAIPCRVNLIKYHAVPGIALPASRPEAMLAFRDYLNTQGIIATVRASRGEDILAACGMLRTHQETSLEKP